jgi:hypothetical protein
MQGPASPAQCSRREIISVVISVRRRASRESDFARGDSTSNRTGDLTRWFNTATFTAGLAFPERKRHSERLGGSP